MGNQGKFTKKQSRKTNVFPYISVLISHQAPVVQKVDNAIHRINHHPVDSVVCFVNIYPLDSVIQPLNNRSLVTKHIQPVEKPLF